MIRKRFVLFLSLLPLAPWIHGATAPQGALFIIGGALKTENQAIYQEMIRLAGGTEAARVAVVVAASAEPVRSGQETAEAFAAYGIPSQRIDVLPLAVLDDPGTADVDESQWQVNNRSADLVRRLAGATLVFFCGGDQMRYRGTLLNDDGSDTPVLKAVRDLYRRGGVVAGTSAGAAVMSERMIVSGTSLGALTDQGANKLALARGFGFLPGVIVDQHFIKRGRVGRLLAALLHADIRPGPSWGCGIDEDSAMVVLGDEARVLGRSGLLIVDVAGVELTERVAARTICGVRVHYLHHGDSVLLTSREFRVDPRRSLIEPGQEYHETLPSSADVFGKDTFLDLLTQGLADCRQRQVYGLAFDPSAAGAVLGVRLKLYKSDAFRPYLGKIGGEYTYTILHAGLDITPVRVRIKEVRNRVNRPAAKDRKAKRVL